MKKYEIKTIKQIANTQSGGTPSRKVKDYYNGDIPWVKSGELRENIITETEEKITQTAIDKSSAKLLPINTLLVAMYGANVGRVAILGIEAATNQAICAIQPKDDLLSTEYLYYYFIYYKNQLLDKAFGGAQKNISQQVIKNLEIPFPTIQQQKQIVSKIKECFTLLDRSEEKLKNAETNSKIFLDSILKKSLDINSAKVVELDEIATLINGDRGKNYPNKSALVKSGIPFITAGHIQNHKIDYDEMNYITEERYEILNSGKIQNDDILFCLRGSLGKIAIVEETNKGAIASSLVIIRPNTDIMSKYLYYYLLSQYGQNQIREYDNGTAQPNLSASNLKKFIIKVPEIDKQKEIIKQVEQLSSFIDTIKRNLLVQRETYSNLRQSILKKAFEGKLI